MTCILRGVKPQHDIYCKTLQTSWKRLKNISDLELKHIAVIILEKHNDPASLIERYTGHTFKQRYEAIIRWNGGEEVDWLCHRHS